MKAERERRVPLSDQARSTVRSGHGSVAGCLGLQRARGADFPCTEVWHGHERMTLLAILRRLKIDATIHGFRSSFRDWAAECSGPSWAIRESALAHSVESGVEQAYMRSDLLDQRRNLMEAWTEFCTG